MHLQIAVQTFLALPQPEQTGIVASCQNLALLEQLDQRLYEMCGPVTCPVTRMFDVGYRTINNLTGRNIYASLFKEMAVEIVNGNAPLLNDDARQLRSVIRMARNVTTIQHDLDIAA